MTQNFLISLPHFQKIDVKNFESQLQALLQQHKQTLEKLLQQKNFSWDSLIAPIETMDDELQQFWSPFSHINSVANNEETRECHQNCLRHLTEYHTEREQNAALYQAYQQIHDNQDAFAALSQAQQQTIRHAIRDFKLAGVALAAKQKQEFCEVATQLADRCQQFENNVLDATDAWHIHLIDASRLGGIPQQALQSAASLAKNKNLEGFVFNLEYPSYMPVITYADDRTLREEIYHARISRASDCGPHADQWDNTALMDEILGLRHQLASLVGYETYADYSLACKMAESPQQVLDFLEELINKLLPQAQLERADLVTFAKQQGFNETLQAWDVAYYSEKLREQQYGVSQEALRPYFPAPQVCQGLFDVVQRLWGIQIQAISPPDVWHPDVICYQLKDNLGKLIGHCYVDLYARPSKRGGAWMDEFCTRRLTSQGKMQLPVAYVTCNFTSPQDDQPALLTHDEVITLFHEFGHALHHLLTTMDVMAVSGINGVAWDAVELPSQFLENWCWQQESLALFAKHWQTGESLPADHFEKLFAAKNFQSALFLLRQIEFALFDMQIHLNYSPKHSSQVQSTLDGLRARLSLFPVAQNNRFQHSFTHIFGGGYAAGYYSYLWAEVLSSDAFAAFEETSLFDQTTGQAFLTKLLSQGGSQDAMDLFKAFRGREPSIEALLRHHGVLAS